MKSRLRFLSAAAWFLVGRRAAALGVRIRRPTLQAIRARIFLPGLGDAAKHGTEWGDRTGAASDIKSLRAMAQGMDLLYHVKTHTPKRRLAGSTGSV